MPNTREKLLELMKECFDFGYNFDESADHLITHGVTLQEHDHHWATEQAYKNGYEAGKPKWIPVTERLPEYGEEVLIFTVDKMVTTSRCVGMRVDRYQDITHWMPLPEPPKGE